MSKQPIIFDIKYTPFKLNKGANDYQIEKHAEERRFYDMTGEKNIFDYINTEDKRIGEKKSQMTMFEYLQKNTGVFNHKGMLRGDETAEMKARAAKNTGLIWHGFISFGKEDSVYINTPEKCIDLIRYTFPTFLKEAGFKPDNIDLMCALHLDRPHHLHIHFVFWEKEPKIKTANGTIGYRCKGRINEKAIDGMFIRLGLFADESKDGVYKARDAALDSLKSISLLKTALHSREDIEKEIISLSKDLPATGRLSYGSDDMKPFRERIDKIIEMLLDYDETARKADERFYDQLESRRKKISEIIDGVYLMPKINVKIGQIEKQGKTVQRHIDKSRLDIVEKIEVDYKVRQGNLILNLCKYIKPEYFERKQGRRYKTNDTALKRRLNISRRNVGRRFDRFFLTFGKECEWLERDFSKRLQEIEEEIEKKSKSEQSAEVNNTKKGVNYKD